MKLPIDEYYGVAAEALCEAVMKADKRGVCNTYLFKFIHHRILDYLKKERHDSGDGEVQIVYLDSEIREGDIESLHEIVSTEKNNKKNLNLFPQIDIFFRLLSYREKLVALRLIEGYNFSEVSKQLGVDRKTIFNIRRRIKQKYIAGGFLP